MKIERDRGEVLLRGVQANRLLWDENKQLVLPALVNFKLRKGEVGLSVERKTHVASYESISQRGRFECFISVEVGQIRDLGLSIRNKEYALSAAEIIGLPSFDDLETADDWAIALANVFEWEVAPGEVCIQKVKWKYESQK